MKRPAINGVRFQVLGGKAEATEGVLCVSAFFLIFSSRRQTSQDEVTVSIDNASSKLSSKNDFYLFRFFTPPSVRLRTLKDLYLLYCS